MRVFISWSGEPSHAVALALRVWFPSVIQSIEPYVSSEDIEKGAPWFAEIAQELNDTAFGVICVSRANAGSRWLNFEAGALFKSVQNIKSRVSPFLIDLKATDLVGPLAQLQTTEPNRDDVIRLVKMFDSQSEPRIGAARVEAAIEKWWPDLEKQLEAARKSAETQAKPERRSHEDMLEEILEISRGLQRQALRTLAPENLDDTSYTAYRAVREPDRTEAIHKDIWSALDRARDRGRISRPPGTVSVGNTIQVEVADPIPDDVMDILNVIATRWGLPIEVIVTD
jgi:hypothetical protein